MIVRTEVQTRGLRFQYRQVGTGAPVIFLHGYPQTSREWLGVMQSMGPEFALFAPDTRGFGGTDKPRIRVTLDLLARDVIDFMDALGLERATLIGHDFGGMIATTAALQYGDRFSRVAVLDSTASVWTPAASHGYWFKVPGLAEDFLAEYHEPFIEAIFRGGDVEFPAMPAGPFPEIPAFPANTWCDSESLAEYQACYRDPDSQWSAISYYRDALPFHRLGERGYELIQPGEIEEMWLTEGGYSNHPSYGEFHVYAPERVGWTFDGPALYAYTRTLVPAAFPPSPETLAGALPTAGNPAAASFAEHFPRLRGVPFDSGHFIPEEQPRRLAEVLSAWIRSSE